MNNDYDFLHNTFDSLDSETKASGKIQNINNVPPDIYLVEDDDILCQALKKYLEKTLGLLVFAFKTPGECLLSLNERANSQGEVACGHIAPFCLITDISFDDGGYDGLLLIDLLKEKKYDFASIVMTGFASIETAINATKKGVFHYLTKPFDLEILKDLVIRAMTVQFNYSVDVFSEKNQLENCDDHKTKSTKTIFTSKFKIECPNAADIFCGMIGRSKQMKEVFEKINKVAHSDSTVLINGPSGTGKELVAQAIQKLSLRKNKSFISVNCGAIPSDLLESELFGHEKGAFTGAISTRKGRFEVAHEGTIFLDEIGDMPLLLQVKLLRVLQNRVIERVGSSDTIPINVRIITATHRDLDEQVKKGDFREDLFYRLNVIPIKVPSLAKRREDIPLLISFFLNRFSSADGSNKIEFDSNSLEVLMTYDWPGNVRELENLIERLVILKGGSEITISDLPAKFLNHTPHVVMNYESMVTLPEEGIDLKNILSDIEDSLISQALERTHGNKNQASKLLNLNRTTLIEKMKKKNLLNLN